MGQKKGSGHPKICVSTLGDLLKSRREAAGSSLSQLALELGISRPYLTRLEQGTYTHPSPMVLSRISKLLNVPPEDLYALTGYLPPSELPSFAAYLRAKHPDWPSLVIAELDDFRDFLKHKHSLS
jgi:transcriptional regulator with XRE-family HTH domain